MKNWQGSFSESTKCLDVKTNKQTQKTRIKKSKNTFWFYFHLNITVKLQIDDGFNRLVMKDVFVKKLKSIQKKPSL